MYYDNHPYPINRTHPIVPYRKQHRIPCNKTQAAEARQDRLPQGGTGLEIEMVKNKTLTMIFNIFSAPGKKDTDLGALWEKFKEQSPELIEHQRKVYVQGQWHRVNERWVEGQAERQLFNDENKM